MLFENHYHSSSAVFPALSPIPLMYIQFVCLFTAPAIELAVAIPKSL
jgi:hypothetical protein